MQARVVITPDGKVSIFTEQGTFKEGKERIEKLLKNLGLEGVEFDEVGEVEQHRHNHEHAHAHQHVRQPPRTEVRGLPWRGQGQQVD